MASIASSFCYESVTEKNAAGKEQGARWLNRALLEGRRHLGLARGSQCVTAKHADFPDWLSEPSPPSPVPAQEGVKSEKGPPFGKVGVVRKTITIQEDWVTVNWDVYILGLEDQMNTFYRRRGSCERESARCLDLVT